MNLFIQKSSRTRALRTSVTQARPPAFVGPCNTRVIARFVARYEGDWRDWIKQNYTVRGGYLVWPWSWLLSPLHV